VLSQLPPHFESASLIDFPEDTIQEIIDWRNHPRQGLVIFGKAGRGKTYLAAAAARSLILIHCEALFRRAFQFFSEVRHALSAGEEEAVFAKYVSAPYLFIDDFDAANCSDFERRFLLELIDRRIDHLRSTCITTNSTLAQVGKSLDERIASRLAEFRWIHLEGPDHRQFPRLGEPRILTISDEMRIRYQLQTEEARKRFGISA